jgi:hypothetical protein
MDTEWNPARFDWTVLFAARNARKVLEAFLSCLRCLSFSPSLLLFICREKGDAFVFRALKMMFLLFLTYVFQHADSATTSHRIVRIQALSTTSRHYRFDPFQNATLEDTEPGSQLIISSREGCSYIKAE